MGDRKVKKADEVALNVVVRGWQNTGKAKAEFVELNLGLWRFERAQVWCILFQILLRWCVGYCNLYVE